MQSICDFTHQILVDRIPFFYFVFKCRDPVIRRHILRLKAGNLICALKIFQLQCSYILMDFRLASLERRVKRW